MNKLVSGAVGVPVVMTGRRVQLPDVLALKNKRIKHIDVADAVWQTSEGQTVVNQWTLLQGRSFITIREQNTQENKIHNLPLSDLILSRNHGNRPFINKIIDMPNSYLEWNYEARNEHLVVGRVIFLIFWYDEPLVMNRIKEGGKTTMQGFEVDIINTDIRKITFGDNRNLVNKKFRNLHFHSMAGYGLTPAGKTPVSLWNAQASFLTLQSENFKFIRNVPVYVFYQLSQYFSIRLQNVVFDFLNSYVEVAPSVPLETNSCFYFVAEIDDND